MNGPIWSHDNFKLKLSRAGNSLTVRHLNDIVFLIDMKNKLPTVKRHLNLMGFFVFVTIEPCGLSGSLCLAWRFGCHVTIVKITIFLIYTSIFYGSKRKDFDILFMHINSEESTMRNHFCCIKQYASSLNNQSLLMGDFNAVLDCNEKTRNLCAVNSKMNFSEILFIICSLLI